MIRPLSFRYFEFEVVTTGMMRCGWAIANIPVTYELGNENNAYIFDGMLVSYFQILAFVHATVVLILNQLCFQCIDIHCLQHLRLNKLQIHVHGLPFVYMYTEICTLIH